jgi:hypothetical protein
LAKPIFLLAALTAAFNPKALAALAKTVTRAREEIFMVLQKSGWLLTMGCYPIGWHCDEKKTKKSGLCLWLLWLFSPCYFFSLRGVGRVEDLAENRKTKNERERELSFVLPVLYLSSSTTSSLGHKQTKQLLPNN